MRRGRRSRQSVGHTGSVRARQERQQSEGRANRRSRSGLTSDTTSLRRSERLSGGLLESGLAEEAEATRARLRISSRQSRITEEREEEREEPNIGRRNSTSYSPPTGPNSMHHNTNINGAMSGPDRSYELELAYHLPQRVQVNTPISPSPAVQLHIRNPTTGYEISGQDELGNLFVTISLCREDGEGPLPQNHETQGTAASLESINEGTQSSDMSEPNDSGANIPLDQQVGSFAHFSNFKIIRPGDYRLKFMLVKVEQPGSVPPGSRGVDRGGSRVLTTYVSPDVIVAQEDPVSQFYDNSAIQFIDHVRANGSNMPAPQ